MTLVMPGTGEKVPSSKGLSERSNPGPRPIGFRDLAELFGEKALERVQAGLVTREEAMRDLGMSGDLEQQRRREVRELQELAFHAGMEEINVVHLYHLPGEGDRYQLNAYLKGERRKNVGTFRVLSQELGRLRSEPTTPATEEGLPQSWAKPAKPLHSHEERHAHLTRCAAALMMRRVKIYEEFMPGMLGRSNPPVWKIQGSIGDREWHCEGDFEKVLGQLVRVGEETRQERGAPL